MAVAALLAGFLVILAAVYSVRPAEAVPAYARQTGEPCAACHNGAFPQLTPFGREFKLNGYTGGGRTCSFSDSVAAYAANQDPVIPLSAMVIGSFTHSQADHESSPANRKGDPNGLGVNNNWMVQDTSIFLAGQLFCKVGSFAQATYDRNDQAFFLDNTDVRYADQKRVAGHNLTYGFDVNNNPTVEDPWNTTPAWRIPGGGSVVSSFAPGMASPMIENMGGAVAGAGGYIWLDNHLYLGLWNYRNIDDKTLQGLGEGPAPGWAFDGAAPYWRAGYEGQIGDWTLMGGACGMDAKIIPDVTLASSDDRFANLGYDAQIQYLHGKHFITARVNYETEKLNLSGSNADGYTTDTSAWLDQLNLSLTYAYDSTWSATGAYFATRGSTSDFWQGVSDGMGGFSPGPTSPGILTTNNSPNSRGEFLELGYSPFSNGGPKIYPWFNTRVGLQYWHYDKLNGNAVNYDGSGRNASGDNTFMLFSWTAF